MPLFVKKPKAKAGTRTVATAPPPAATSSFTEAYSATSTPVGTSVWEDWNISALVPAGATLVFVECRIVVAGNYQVGVRKDGSAIDRTAQLTNTIGLTRLMVVERGNGIIERFSDSPGNTNFRVVGYL